MIGITFHLHSQQCHRPQAIRALFKQVPYSTPKRVALMGGGCSVASEPTAEISHHFNIMQVSQIVSQFAGNKILQVSLFLLSVTLFLQ